jgi:DNA-binding response OmpR family regulator
MQPKRLLMVDDDAAMGDFVRTVAEPLGYKVETCVDARGFMAAMDDGDPDVVILDLVMPGTDGIELIHYLSRRQSRARVFIMSGFDPVHLRMGKTLGDAAGLTMAGIIPKPVRANELRRILSKFSGG